MYAPSASRTVHESGTAPVANELLASQPKKTKFNTLTSRSVARSFCQFGESEGWYKRFMAMAIKPGVKKTSALKAFSTVSSKPKPTLSQLRYVYV